MNRGLETRRVTVTEVVGSTSSVVSAWMLELGSLFVSLAARFVQLLGSYLDGQQSIHFSDAAASHTSAVAHA